MNINDGRVNYVGEWGWDWSRTSRSSTNAYNLQFGVSDINPSNNNNRWNGFPLRWGGRGAVPIFEILGGYF